MGKKGNDAIKKNGETSGKDRNGTTTGRRNEARESQPADDRLRSSRLPQDPEKPKRHGPYYQLSYVHQGKSTTQFIQKELVPMVARQLKNYKKFKSLTSEWIELALAIAKEKLALDKQRLKTEAENQRD